MLRCFHECRRNATASLVEYLSAESLSHLKSWRAIQSKSKSRKENGKG
uniref:Uncharacterized protein n=1 Tax=Medicago truncatula TaxID=3880 RepID=Q2HTI4_MEDTR|nr:hypothetical protein MtrDRAFT_AC150441g5v1 [Medicago truncatula]